MPGVIKILKRKILEIFSLDLRSLALFRMSLAGIILYDLMARSTDLVSHYTDVGILPSRVQIDNLWQVGFFSLHTLNGSVYYQAILFVIAGIFAISLFVGYHTRLVTIISWLLVVSLQSRNALILHGGDVVFRLLLFWAMFLPLGAKWSLDSLAQRAMKFPSLKYTSLATFCLIAQIIQVYTFNFLTKTDPVWREQFEAVYYALSIDYLTSDIGRHLLMFPGILKILTIGSLVIESCGPLLLLIPFYNSFFKFAAVFLFVSFHLGLFISMELGFFPFVCIAAWLVFLPAFFWEKMIRPIIPTQVVQKLKYSLKQNAIPHLYSPQKKFSPKGWLLLKKSTSLFLNCFVVISIVYITLWNLRSIDFKKYEKIFPPSINSFAYAFRLDQYWSMFAPRPLKDDGWFVLVASLNDGSQVNLFTGEDTISWDRPLSRSFYHSNQRWRKYIRNIWLKKYAKYRKHFAQYLCNQWNETHNPNEHISKIKFYYMRENTLPNHEFPRIKKFDLGSYRCQSPIK